MGGASAIALDRSTLHRLVSLFVLWPVLAAPQAKQFTGLVLGTTVSVLRRHSLNVDEATPRGKIGNSCAINRPVPDRLMQPKGVKFPIDRLITLGRTLD